MRLIRAGSRGAQVIDAFGSRNAAFTKIAESSHDAHLGVMRLDAGGVIGYHQAAAAQLFVIVDGAGWVAGQDRIRLPVTTGDAAFWESGEWHESGTETGMTAAIFEAESLSLRE